MIDDVTGVCIDWPLFFHRRIVIINHQRQYLHLLRYHRQPMLPNVLMLLTATEHQHLDRKLVISFMYLFLWS
ncbi:unnamed protein product [Adineta ricciae]|uniref:Uncharacterized protein n=1 Tax=Adineta ricciae TaxID=249248 RepID=A0A815B7L3_ADIRI|nr:unnamed protein product [Adineta ricciae]